MYEVHMYVCTYSRVRRDDVIQRNKLQGRRIAGMQIRRNANNLQNRRTANNLQNRRSTCRLSLAEIKCRGVCNLLANI